MNKKLNIDNHIVYIFGIQNGIEMHVVDFYNILKILQMKYSRNYK